MGLQKGQSGYAFRWLMPVFSLIGSLMVFANAIFVSIIGSGAKLTSELMDFDLIDLVSLIAEAEIKKVVTILNVYTAVVWICAISLLAVAILGFAMNKKFSYILGTVLGALVSIFYLAHAVVMFIAKATLEDTAGYFIDDIVGSIILVMGILFLIVFIFALCVALFGILGTVKCRYPEAVDADFSNAQYGADQYGEQFGGDQYGGNQYGSDQYGNQYGGEQYRDNQYGGFNNAPPVAVGKITGVNGMYRDASFPINDNEELIIGRDPSSSQIVIGENAQNVSRMHCCVTYNAATNTYSINDISKNGTFTMDNKARFPHGVYSSVPAGTVIYLGDKKNSFRLG